MLAVLLLAPFYLNDFGFIYLHGRPYWFLLLDYACRIFVLVIAARAMKRQRLKSEDLGLIRMPQKELWRLAFLLCIAGITIDRTCHFVLKPLLESTALYHFPKLVSPMIKLFDLTFGIALVSLSEEAVFRGYVMNVLKRRGWPMRFAIVVQTGLFGLIHWGAGAHSVLGAFAWALLPSLVTWRTGSIYPAVVAHFATDFVAFF